MKQKIVLLFLTCISTSLILAQVIPNVQITKEIPKAISNADISKLLTSNWNFENGNLTGWISEGTGFNNQPTYGGIHISQYPNKPTCWDKSPTTPLQQSWNCGYQGNYWIGSSENHPASTSPINATVNTASTGTLTSSEFIANDKIISFLLAGNSSRKLCSIDILVLNDGSFPLTDNIPVEPETRLVAGRPVTIPRTATITYATINFNTQNFAIVHSIVNTEEFGNDKIRTNNAAALKPLDNIKFVRTGFMINEKFRGKKVRIRITDNDDRGYISVDDFKFETALSPQPIAQVVQFNNANCPLQGIVDLHTHPMSYLGFGKKAVHGVLDIGSLLPAGTNGCNPTSRRATSIEEALGNCNSTHGGWGVDNGCGDYLRAAIINYALDGNFKYVVPFERNPHGDHEHTGYPNFPAWPHQTSILHQQMWVDWIRRAHAGGINVIVALTVNSELLATISNGDGPFDDKTVADEQIAEMKLFVSRHNDFMEVAYSPTDMRRIVNEGKLAVILGMEIDKIGNFGKAGVTTNESTVRAEIKRLYNNGIRYAFPVHLINNSFGGTAVYSMLFNFANKHANGSHFGVKHSTDPNIKYSADVRVDGTPTPAGLDNSLILGVYGLLEGIGQIPAPCFNDVIKCSPPPGKIRCCGSYESIMNIMKPSPELDAYKFIPSGHMNVLGLTDLGEVAINEMMKLGIMIDIDHMGEISQNRAIQIAEGIAVGSSTPGYPLMMGHNAIRGTNEHTMKERSAPTYLINRVAALGGMFGIGTADTHPTEFIADANNAFAAMGNKNIAIGTDVNGFEKLPKSERLVYDFNTQNEALRYFTSTIGICKTGNKTWNYFTDGGVAHYGMMPEFFWEVKRNSSGNEVMNRLNNSAEQLAKLWEKIDVIKSSIR